VIRVRRYRAGDAAPLHAIFYRAVHEGAAAFYSVAEQRAWAPHTAPPSDWAARLADQITCVAEEPDGPVGFMTLGHDGHLDLAYVAPETMGRGVASALHDRILAEAQARGLTTLDTEASHLARRFFLRQGWRDHGAQQVARGDVRLTNFRMTKTVAPRGG